MYQDLSIGSTRGRGHPPAGAERGRKRRYEDEMVSETKNAIAKI